MGKSIAIVVLSALVIVCFVQWIGIRVRASFAEEQTQYFEEAIQKAASAKTASEVDRLIEAIQNYYPSGSKQTRGTHLDGMVERARRLAVERVELMKKRLEEHSSGK